MPTITAVSSGVSGWSVGVLGITHYHITLGALQSKSMDYILAIDGGGTKTDILCADLTGKVVGKGVSGSSNLTATSIGAASMNVIEGIRQATEQLPEGWKIKKLILGLAGVDTKNEAIEAQRIFTEALSYLHIEEFIILNDADLALRSGTDHENALAIIAGTGSNCYGRNDQHQEARVGGMDFLLSDEGSGYAIGSAVLHAAVKSFDGRAPKTRLEELVAQNFQVASIAELKNVVYHPLTTKSEVAQLAKLCNQAFTEGDKTAKAIFDQAINDLAEMARTVMIKLNLSDKSTDCVLVGGVFAIEYIREGLETQLRDMCPQVNVILPSEPPVAGALKLALRVN